MSEDGFNCSIASGIFGLVGTLLLSLHVNSFIPMVAYFFLMAFVVGLFALGLLLGDS